MLRLFHSQAQDYPEVEVATPNQHSTHDMHPCYPLVALRPPSPSRNSPRYRNSRQQTRAGISSDTINTFTTTNETAGTYKADAVDVRDVVDVRYVENLL